MEKEDKRGIFFGIIGVLTLIVAIIGASFAYFSINASSTKDALTVNAASVKIVFAEGDSIAMDNLIPATRAIAMKTLTRALNGETYKGGESGNDDIPYAKCKDDNNYTTCGYYDFSLTNNGENAVQVKAYVIPTALQGEVVDLENPENNKPAEIGFTHLKFVLFDRTSETGNGNGTEVYGGNVSYNASGFGLLGDDINTTLTLDGNGASKKYRLFIYLEEAGEDNNAEQGATFKGTIHVDLPGAENITGVAN